MKTINRAEIDAMAALEQLPTPPGEVKYAAQDADGRWFAFLDEPTLNGILGMWIVAGGQQNNYFRLTDRFIGPRTQEPSELYELI